MGELSISLADLAFVGGLIVTLGGVAALFSRLLSPYRALKKSIERHDELLAKDKRAIDEIKEGMAEERKTNRVLCKAVLALLDNRITGNSVDKLQVAKGELQQHLIDS